MKVRNILIGLLVVLMAFVFISCEDEPEPQPKPNPSPSNGEIYQIQITEGVDKDYYNRDKIKLVWKEEIYEGDTITLKYRSERTINQWDIRDGDSALWVYEKYLNGLETPVLGDDGWYTLSYTFGDGITKKGEAADISYPYTNGFGIYFRGNFVTTDLFEIKDIMLNGQPLEVTSDNITSKAALTDPAVDFNWSQKNYAVLFATGTPGEVDKTPIAEKVPAGGTVTGAPIAKEGYTLTIYNDSAHTEIFDQTQPINEEKIFYYEYVGVPRTVSFVTGTEDVIEDIIVPNGDLLTLPADPENGGFEFAGWYLDPGYTEKFVAASTPITGNTTLYAKWALHVWTVTIDLNDGSAASVIQVEEGNTVLDSEIPDVPIIPGVFFDGWHEFAEEVFADDEFDFTAAVTADHVVKAKWIEPTTAYKLVATIAGGGGTDKYILSWEGDSSLALNENDILSFKYRSTTSFDKYNVRGADKWFYEAAADGTYLIVGEPDEDGWIPVTFMFAERYADGHTPNAKAKESDPEYGKVDYSSKPWFRFDFINQSSSPILINDILEVKGIALNGEELPLYKVDGSSSGYCTPAVANADIDDIIVDIVDWPATVNVTINYDNGGEADPRTGAVPADFGVKASDFLDATDTSKGSLVFQGWFTDAECTEEFDSRGAITEPITIYGKWLSAFAVTLHNYDGSSTRIDYVGQDVPMDEPRGIGYVGYLLDGWYTDAGLTSEWNFADDVTEDMDLYAKWEAPTEYYQYTVTDLGGKPNDRMQFRFKSSSVSALSDLKEGDVITFMVKSNASFAKIRVRTYTGSKNVFYYYEIPDAATNVWMPVTMTVGSDFLACGGITIALYNASASAGVVNAGDVLEIKALAFNGVSIPITDSSSCGLYPSSDEDAWYGGPANKVVVPIV